MRPQKQAFLHDPDNGVYGDCARTAIACLLDLERDVVPHFHDDRPYHVCANAKREWLASQGLVEISIPYQGELSHILCTFAAQNPGNHYMLSGKSRTECSHVVICRNEKIVWDTSLTNSGIIGPTETGFYFISVLVRKL